MYKNTAKWKLTEIRDDLRSSHTWCIVWCYQCMNNLQNVMLSKILNWNNLELLYLLAQFWANFKIIICMLVKHILWMLDKSMNNISNNWAWSFWVLIVPWENDFRGNPQLFKNFEKSLLQDFFIYWLFLQIILVTNIFLPLAV